MGAIKKIMCKGESANREEPPRKIEFSSGSKIHALTFYFYPTRLGRVFPFARSLVEYKNNNSQVELENWVNSIHSACAAAFARHRGKTGTLHLLQEEIFRLDKAIESVCSAIDA